MEMRSKIVTLRARKAANPPAAVGRGPMKILRFGRRKVLGNAIKNRRPTGKKGRQFSAPYEQITDKPPSFARLRRALALRTYLDT